LRNPEKVLRDIKKYLAAEGKLILSTGNVAYWYIRLALLFGFFTYTECGILDNTHLRLFTRKTFKELIVNCGFRIIGCQYTVVPYELLLPSLKDSKILRGLSSLSHLLTKLLPGLF